VLDNINLDIQAGEKIGLCGRTGSGKSSLALSLFRILEPTSGSISISSLPVTQNFGLSDLRSKITVIPQDAFLFVGTLRTNLAPFGEYDDELLWRALDGAHLKSVVVGMEGGLDTVVQENGENFRWVYGSKKRFFFETGFIDSMKPTARANANFCVSPVLFFDVPKS
jgi:ABC-type multidrug transport system fused ATPase/permease subunit